MHTISIRRITAVCTEDHRQHWAWGHFKQRGHQQKHNNKKIRHHIDCEQDSVELKQEGSVSPCETSAGSERVRQLRFLTTHTCSPMTVRTPRIWTWGITNKFQQVGGFTNTESTNSEDQLYEESP